MAKTVVEYNLPINSEEECERINKMFKKVYGVKFTPLITTEEHLDILVNKLLDGIDKVGDEGGWYLGDGIKVRIELEYDPEDK